MKLFSQYIETVNENNDEEFVLIDFTRYDKKYDEHDLKNNQAFKIRNEVARVRFIGPRQECYKQINFENNEDEYVSVVPIDVVPPEVIKKYRN